MSTDVKIIVTLGPATGKEEDLHRIKDKGVNFVRVNMSHSSLEDLKYFIGLAKKVGIPFVIDTEGSQIRTGELSTNSISLEENQEVKIYDQEIIGNTEKISFKPGHIVQQLEKGDLIYVDFDTLTLLVSDTSTLNQGYITAKAITSGSLGRNKGVVIDSGCGKRFDLPTLSKKDYESIKIGLEEGIGYIAASFMRSGQAVDEVRRATQNTMKIISKIECMDALENIDEIIRKSDYLLIDRGDLSKEIPIEKIAFTQKIIINKAKRKNKEVFVATNLLETMMEKRKPTRAEVHDIISTIVDGARGLALAGETAIGKHPLECINMLNKLIKHAQLAINIDQFKDKEDKFVDNLEQSNYLLDRSISSSLIPPHGGKLVERVLNPLIDLEYLKTLKKVVIDATKYMDVEQIALGGYSPLEGFMGKEDFESVLDTMKLANGIIWPLPIILDVQKETADKLSIGETIVLVSNQGQQGDAGQGEEVALLHLEEKFTYDKTEMCEKMYGTTDEKHPGVKMVQTFNPILLGGKIDLIKRRETEHKEYELTPKQTRRLFEERGWAKVVGFHTRNVIHRSHEFIQMKALEEGRCDGLLVHPVIGKKKSGDFQAKFIIKSYETMVKNFYPKNRVIFSTLATYSRYAGPREALFTALCRKNHGCSHFIVGRDHTGVGDYYHPKASHNIFDRFPEIGIKAVKFDKVFYSKRLQKHVHEKEAGKEAERVKAIEGNEENGENDRMEISGTQARKMFEQGLTPPEWFMRPEISRVIAEAIQRGEEVFVRE